MKRRFFTYACLGALLIAPLALWTGCSSSDNGPSPEPEPGESIQYAIANVGGAYPSQTTYIQGLPNLDMGSIDNSNATELASFSSQWAYKGAVYLTAFGAPATVTKYTFDSEGQATEAGRLVVSGANTFSSIEFVSETEAYASVGGGLAKLIRFNPSAMEVTAEIDLSSVVDEAASSIYYLGMKARDRKLFIGVQYMDADFNPYPQANVAVIDLEQAKVEKLLTDKRTSNIFLAGSSVSGFALDNSGDLYIQALGGSGLPSGILRIKKGATDFDPDYFFDLKGTTGKDCSSLYIFGDGLAFTTQIQDPDDAYEVNGPNFRYYRIDLADQKSLGDISSSLPNIYGSSTSIMRQFTDGEITFVVSAANENSLYTYSTSSGTVAKKLTMSSGTCTGLDKIN